MGFMNANETRCFIFFKKKQNYGTKQRKEKGELPQEMDREKKNDEKSREKRIHTTTNRNIKLNGNEL